MAKRLPEIPVDPPPAYFSAVGEVAVRWSRLEYQLGVLIRVGFNLGKDEQRTLIFGMDMGALCGVLMGVATGWIRDKALAREIVRLAEEAKGLRTRRGDFVHGLYGHWLGEPTKWRRFIFKSQRQKGNISSEVIDADKIKDFAGELRALQVRAQELTRRLKAVHGTRR